MKTHQMAAKAGGAKGRLSMAVVAALCLAAAPSLSFADELVTNGSFERYTGRIGAGRNGYDGLFDTLSASLVLDGWKKDSKAHGYVGLCTASDSEIWKNVANVKGETACFFQRNASLSQKIKVPKKGTYRVSFRYASRLNPDAYGNGRIYIEIDGKEVGHVDCGSCTDFRTALMETDLTAGNHTLVVRHSDELTTDYEKRANSVIDGISITPKTDLLFNGGFEGYIGVMPTTRFAAADRSLNADGWDGFSYGLSEANSPFLEDGGGSPFEGSRAVHFNGVGEISQKVEIPVSGAYEISFAYAPRNKNNYAGGRVNVWIDDDKVGYVDCDASTVKFRRYAVRTQIDAGSHVFKLTHTLDNPVNPDNKPCSAIDDVSLAAVGSRSGKVR